MQDKPSRLRNRLRRLTKRLSPLLARKEKELSVQAQTRVFMADLDRLRRADDALPENQAENARVAAILRSAPALPCTADAVRRPVSWQSVAEPLSKEERRCLSGMRKWVWEEPCAGQNGSLVETRADQGERPGQVVESESGLMAEPGSSTSLLGSGSRSGISTPSSRSSRFIEHICDEEGILRPPDDFLPPARGCLRSGGASLAEGSGAR